MSARTMVAGTTIVNLERHLRVAEVAQLTGYSIGAIRKLVKAGKIRHRKVNRIIAIPKSAVAHLLGELR